MKSENLLCTVCGLPFLAEPSTRGGLQSVCTRCIVERLRELTREVQQENAAALAEARAKLRGDRFTAEARKGG